MLNRAKIDFVVSPDRKINYRIPYLVVMSMKIFSHRNIYRLPQLTCAAQVAVLKERHVLARGWSWVIVATMILE